MKLAIHHRNNSFSERWIQYCQEIESACTAFDFVIHAGKPLIVEISYGFAISAYDSCPGYWDSNMNWYESHFNPQEWIIKDMLNKFDS